MTQRGAYILTGISAGLYLFLSWAFADGLFSFDNFWNGDEYSSSSIFTYLMLAAILAAGYRFAQTRPTERETTVAVADAAPGEVRDPVLWQRLLGSASLALVWLPLRFFIGREWVSAGEHKVRDSAWMDGGSALQSYWERAAAIPDEGRPSITYGWYREFLQYMLDNEWYTWFAKLIAVGELVLGLALIAGALVGIAAFAGTFMNFNFQLAGSASSNPVLFALSVFLVLAWKVAGYWGVDRYLLPILGAPWRPGRLFTHEQSEQHSSPARTPA